jgi:hypothetical protein
MSSHKNVSTSTDVLKSLKNIKWIDPNVSTVKVRCLIICGFNLLDNTVADINKKDLYTHCVQKCINGNDGSGFIGNNLQLHSCLQPNYCMRSNKNE